MDLVEPTASCFDARAADMIVGTSAGSVGPPASDMRANDHRVFVALARGMASRNGYVAQQSSDLYKTDGDFIEGVLRQARHNETVPGLIALYAVLAALLACRASSAKQLSRPRTKPTPRASTKG